MVKVRQKILSFTMTAGLTLAAIGVAAHGSFARADTPPLSVWTPKQTYPRETPYTGRPSSNKDKHGCEKKAMRRPYASTIVDRQMAPNRRGVFASIEQAIRHTQPGGTVLIMPDTYQETLEIECGVNLIGAIRRGERDRAVVISPQPGRLCMTIDAKKTRKYDDLVQIRGIRFETNRGGQNPPCIFHERGRLRVEDSDFIRLPRDRNSGEPKQGYALYLQGEEAELDSSRIVNHAYGVYVAPSTSFTSAERRYKIFNSFVFENAWGIYADGENANVVLENNTVFANQQAGLYAAKGVVEGRSNRFNYNVMDGVVIIGPRAVRMSGWDPFSGNSMIGNGRYGIYMPFSTRVVLAESTIQCNGEGGIGPEKIEELFKDNNTILENPREDYDWFDRRIRGKSSVCPDPEFAETVPHFGDVEDGRPFISDTPPDVVDRWEDADYPEPLFDDDFEPR